MKISAEMNMKFRVRIRLNEKNEQIRNNLNKPIYQGNT